MVARGEQGAPLTVAAEIGRAWYQRCVATGCATGPADAAERAALLDAFEHAATPNSLAAVLGSRLSTASRPSRPVSTIAARRRALDLAAAEWGRRVGSPTVVVEQVVVLRHLVSASTEGERLGRLVDKVLVAATKAATDELQHAAFSDPLTGCANRRALERDLVRELARCARAELDLCVIVLDVDGLKRVNDSLGHAAGDEVLLRLIDALRQALRGLDGVYRIGGDEFVVILPDASPNGARVVMDRVARLGAPPFSWGVANYLSSGSTNPADLLRAADERLYDRRRAIRGLTGPSPSARRRRQEATVTDTTTIRSIS